MEIEFDLRPCLIKDKRALFHRWDEVRQVVPPSNMIGGHCGGVISQTFGIVELEDGTVKEWHSSGLSGTNGLKNFVLKSN